MRTLPAMIDLMEEKEVYLAEFSRFEKELGNRVSAWPHALRTAAIERFAEVGFPTSRDEDWKFTPLAPLAQVPFKLASDLDWVSAGETLRSLGFDIAKYPPLVFCNGRLAQKLSPPRTFPPGVVVMRLPSADEAMLKRVEG